MITTVQPLRLPDGIVFYDLPAPYDNCWSNWGAERHRLRPGPRLPGADGRAGRWESMPSERVGIPGRQIAGPASVNLTHADMVSGAVTPLIVHRVTIGTVWGVRHTRLVKDPAAPTPAERGPAPGWREF